MPKSWTRLTTRGSYTQEQLVNAIHAVECGMKIRAASREFGIAESTIRLRMKTRNVEPATLGRKATFSQEQEQELADYVLKVANMFYGLTPADLRKLAYEFAEANHIAHNFSQATKMAGKDWLAGFMKRNARISLRKPEGTSINRINAFSKESVSNFFSNLGQVLEKHNFPQNRIYNVDETGISNVQKPVVCAVSASGYFVPPMFIYPRVRMSPHLKEGGPIGAVYTCSKNGWINENLFFDWLQHFSNNTKPTQADPILLILDNHSSHISVRIYNYCRENGITLLSLPPHTSHRLQPLDLTFFSPLKSSFYRECSLFLKTKSISPNEANRKITQYELAGLFNRAYLKVATMDKGISGFSTAGILPINPDKFSELNFHTSTSEEEVQIEITEEDEEPRETMRNEDTTASTQEVAEPIEKCATKEINQEEVVELGPTPGTSTSTPRPIRNSQQVKVVDISPLPGPSRILSSTENDTEDRPKSRKQKSEILTGTPMKEKLEEMERKRERNRPKRKKETKTQKENKTVGKKPRRKACKRQLNLSESESEAEQINEKNLCDDNDDDDIGPINYDVCLICDEFGRDNEMWYRCVGCGRWSHEECSGWDTPEDYLCDLCMRKAKKAK